MVEGVGVVVAQGAAAGREHLPEHRLGVGVAALQAEHPGQPVPGGQVVRMVLIQQPAPVRQDLVAQFLRLAVAAALPDDPGQPVPGGQGVRVVVAQDAAAVGQHRAVQPFRLGVPAGLPGQPGQVLPAGQAVRVVRAEHAELGVEDLAAQFLRLGVPALQPDHPGQAVPGGQGFPVVRSAQPVVVVEEPAVQLLGLAEPPLHAQRRGQVVPGGQGVEVPVSLDPDPVGEQLAVDRLGLAAAAAADQGPGQVAAGVQRGRVLAGQEGRGRHAGLGQLPGRGQPPGPEQRLGPDRADREQPGQHRGVQVVGEQVDDGVHVRPQPPPGRPVGRADRVEPGRGRLEQRHRGLLHGRALVRGAGGQPDPVGVGDHRVHRDRVQAGRTAGGRDVDQPGARETLEAVAEATSFGYGRPVAGTAGQQVTQRRQLQQPGRDGRGGREAGQHQQQRAGLRHALGRQRVQGQVPGALHGGVDVRAPFLDIGQGRGQLHAVQGPAVLRERGPAGERRAQVGAGQVQRQRQAAQAPGQLTRLLPAGIGDLGGQVPQHLGACLVVQRPQLAQRDPGAPDARIPDPGGHDHHPGRVGPQPPGAVGRGARVGTGQHRRVVRALEHQQPAAARAVIAVEELPGPLRRGPGAFPHRAGHRLRRPELPQHLEHPAGQLGRVRRPDPPDAVAALAGHPGRGQRDGRLAQAAHAGDHERPAGPPRVGPQCPAQLPGQRLTPAYLGRQLAERRRDRQRGRQGVRGAAGRPGRRRPGPAPAGPPARPGAPTPTRSTP